MPILGISAAANIKNFLSQLASQILGYISVPGPGSGYGYYYGGGGGGVVETLGQVPVYTVPYYRTAYVSEITVENLSANTITYDLGIVDFGVTLTQGNTIKYDEQIPAYSKVTVSSGITNPLTEGKTIYVFPSAVDQVEVEVYGTETRIPIFAAIGARATFNSVSRAATSTDGVTWVARTLPTDAGGWYSLAYGNGVFLAMAFIDDLAATSSDGVTWTMRTAPQRDWTRLIFANGKFVAPNRVIANSTQVDVASVSTNGITWTESTISVGDGDAYNNITYGNGVFIALGYDTDANRTPQYTTSSTDAVTWTRSTNNLPTDRTGSDLLYGDGLFVAIASGDTTQFNYDKIHTSTNGTNWTERTMPADVRWFSGAHGNGVYVVTAYDSATAASSTDGVTWTQRTLPGTALWRGLTHGNY